MCCCIGVNCCCTCTWGTVACTPTTPATPDVTATPVLAVPLVLKGDETTTMLAGPLQPPLLGANTDWGGAGPFTNKGPEARTNPPDPPPPYTVTFVDIGPLYVPGDNDTGTGVGCCCDNCGCC